MRLRILGPLRVWRDGAEQDVGPRQQAYLLALLLAGVGQPVTTSELIDLIWGDDPPASALNVIHKYVGGLRRLLEPAIGARGTSSYLQRRGNAYVLSAGPGALDLVAFRELLKAAAASLAHGQDERALDHYVEALGLWRGPAGDGFAHATAAMAVFSAIDEEFFSACTAAADLAVSLGRPDRVLPALHLAARMEPFHEPVQAALVSTLGAAGRQAEALSAFGAFRDRLSEELGIEPGPALRAAHLRVLTQASTSSPAMNRAPESGGSGLVGRTEELAVLRQAVQDALNGRTGLGIVEGEPGVGKSSLLEEAAADAGRRGALVVWAACLEGDGAPAMWPWEQTLTLVLDILPAQAREKWRSSDLGVLLGSPDGTPPVLTGSRGQFRLFEQVVGVIGQAAAQQPLLLIVDDLQWADATSLQLFGHLAGRLPARSAMIGSLRDRAPVPGSDLSRVLAAVSRLPGHRRIGLGPLGPDDVAELIRRETGREPDADVARDIHARTAGNPFFVRELSRLLHDDGGGLGDGTSRIGVPSTVRDVVRDRMADLDPDAGELLRIAALIGRDAELRLLASVAGIDVATCLELLDPLRALGMLEPRPDDPFSLRFSHDLVRESVTETMAHQQAIRLHLRIADALEDGDVDDEAVTERLAHHLGAAGPLADPVRAAEAMKRAGRRATAKFAFAAADRYLQEAAQIARTAGLPELELSALSLLAIAPRRQAGYGGTTFDLLERAEQLARRLGRDAEAAGLLFARLFGAYTFLEWNREDLVRRLSEQGRASSDPVVQVYGRQALGLHQWDVGDIGAAYRSFGDNDRAIREGAASPERDDTPIRRDVSGEWPGWQAVVTALHGDVEAAAAMIDRWNGPADGYAVATWAYYMTMIASMAGDAAWVIRVVDRWIAVGTGRLAIQQEHYVRLDWYWARALTGDDPIGISEEAELLLASTLTDPPRFGIAYHLALIAEMWLAAGVPDRAENALDRADRALEAHGQRYAEGLVRLLRARLLQARGEPVHVVRAATEAARDWSAEHETHLFARRAQELLDGLDPVPGRLTTAAASAPSENHG
ncbi:BTAD domain-containing putative transcriptional regulator [Actinomadura rugatobispora]|uniref:BTAD domain-containing putative transcriptional regulator n=1 Tax=Actinomadura rugatobispora TaxID=1994 RepID=A0ABW0ZZ23_9ACTN